MTPGGYIVINFTCSTNLQTSFSWWEINNMVYRVTDLPSNILTNGLSITFQEVFKGVRIRCFVKIFSNGSVINVYSNAVSSDANG